jgi:GNAT superfamily N-acetyltransferase
MTLTLRSGDPARDRAAMLSFIAGLQAYEYEFEKNRRLDSTVAGLHLDKLLKDLAERGGAIFIAEDAEGVPVGWSVVHANEAPIFVIEADRRQAYIAELYLVERARGTGTGRALIQACEDWARAQGIAIIGIGVLPGNTRAHAVYRRAGYADYAVELLKDLRKPERSP